MTEENQSYEADNRSGINHEGASANRPVERLTATSIIGMITCVERSHQRERAIGRKIK